VEKEIKKGETLVYKHHMDKSEEPVWADHLFAKKNGKKMKSEAHVKSFLENPNRPGRTIRCFRKNSRRKNLQLEKGKVTSQGGDTIQV